MHNFLDFERPHPHLALLTQFFEIRILIWDLIRNLNYMKRCFLFLLSNKISIWKSKFKSEILEHVRDSKWKYDFEV